MFTLNTEVLTPLLPFSNCGPGPEGGVSSPVSHPQGTLSVTMHTADILNVGQQQGKQDVQAFSGRMGHLARPLLVSFLLRVSVLIFILEQVETDITEVTDSLVSRENDTGHYFF